jgi:hypothetical protein
MQRCSTCTHKGDILLAANGKPVGSEGCGCSPASMPTGIHWYHCNHESAKDRTAPMRETVAESCEHYQQQIN